MLDGKYSYYVELKMPLGKRNGKIDVEINNDVLTGSFTILGQVNPIVGTVQNNAVVFKGKIKTILYDLDFMANGFIDEEEIKLDLKTRKGIFKTIQIKNKCEGKGVIC